MDFSQSTAWPALHPPLLTRLPRAPVHPNPASLPPSQRYKSNQFPTLQDEADQLDWDEDQWINSVGSDVCSLCCSAAYNSSLNQIASRSASANRLLAFFSIVTRHERVRILVAYPTRTAEHARRRCRGVPSLASPAAPFAPSLKLTFRSLAPPGFRTTRRFQTSSLCYRCTSISPQSAFSSSPRATSAEPLPDEAAQPNGINGDASMEGAEVVDLDAEIEDADATVSGSEEEEEDEEGSGTGSLSGSEAAGMASSQEDLGTRNGAGTDPDSGTVSRESRAASEASEGESMET